MTRKIIFITLYLFIHLAAIALGNAFCLYYGVWLSTWGWSSLKMEIGISNYLFTGCSSKIIVQSM